MTIPKDFKEFFELLNGHGVEYAVVGGYAMAFHGVPRFTGDIDVLIAPSEANAQSLIAALADFGFAFSDLKPDDFQTPDRVVQFGVPPLRIDVLSSIDGVTWNEVKAHILSVTVDGVEFFYIGRDELLSNKRATGRAKDLADLEALGEL